MSPGTTHTETDTETELPTLIYSDLEDDLRSTVRDMLAAHAAWPDVLGRIEETRPDQKLWTRLAVDLGCAGLAVAEDLGGAGATWSEVAVVLEELGRSVADVPFLASSVLATALLQAVGVEGLDGVEDVLSGIAAGETIASVVVPLSAPSLATTTVEFRDDAVHGSVPLVLGALEASVLLVPTSRGLALVDPAQTSVRRDRTPSLDMTRPLADVSFDAAPATLLKAEDVDAALQHAHAVSCALLASEQLGIAEACLDMTVAYLQDRRQFGRVLASFQALKHRLADVWTDLTQARAVARYAAACASTATPSAPGDLHVAAALAQVVCSRVAQRAAEECVQLHGGIGFTWEHPAHLFLKRARTDSLAFGSPAHHRGRLAQLVDLPAPTLH